MRQIEKDMLAAIARNDREWKQANTRVHQVAGGVEVQLHGHTIARHDGYGWSYNLCGWNTPTTRSRLNALGAHVASKAGQPHVMGRAVPADGWFTNPVHIG